MHAGHGHRAHPRPPQQAQQAGAVEGVVAALAEQHVCWAHMQLRQQLPGIGANPAAARRRPNATMAPYASGAAALGCAEASPHAWQAATAHLSARLAPHHSSSADTVSDAPSGVSGQGWPCSVKTTGAPSSWHKSMVAFTSPSSGAARGLKRSCMSMTNRAAWQSGASCAGLGAGALDMRC